MSDTTQGKLDFGDPALEEQVEAFVRAQLRAPDQPSAWDLLARIEEHVGCGNRVKAPTSIVSETLFRSPHRVAMPFDRTSLRTE
jgi:hypothetical protein